MVATSVAKVISPVNYNDKITPLGVGLYGFITRADQSFHSLNIRLYNKRGCFISETASLSYKALSVLLSR